MSASRPLGPLGGLFGFGHIRRMREDILAYCLENQQKYGDSVHYQIANIPIFQFTHPEQAYELLVTKHRSFFKTKRLKEVLGQWNGNGLVLNEGDSWIRQRRLVNPAFRAQELRSHIDAIARRADGMLDTWKGKRDVELTTELGSFTLGVVAEALFGADFEPYRDRFIAEVAVLNETAAAEMTSPIVWPMWAPLPAKRRMRRAVEFLKGLVEGVIAERRKGKGKGGDLLSLLIGAVDEEGDGGRMSDVQVRDETINLLLGGNETTATGLVWAAHLLSKAPEIQDEIHAEIIEVLGEQERVNALEKMREAPSLLRKTEMVFKEALRLYPPVYVLTREAIEDGVTIGGYSIPKGANVQIVPFFMQRDPRWFDDPLAFRPSRFEKEASFQRGAYIPFGVGPRACVGKSFALMEGTLLLAMLVRRYRLRPLEGAPDVEMEAQISLHPRGGLRLAIEPR